MAKARLARMGQGGARDNSSAADECGRKQRRQARARQGAGARGAHEGRSHCGPALRGLGGRRAGQGRTTGTASMAELDLVEATGHEEEPGDVGEGEELTVRLGEGSGCRGLPETSETSRWPRRIPARGTGREALLVLPDIDLAA